MIYLSASGIKDFLVCPQRYRFRVTNSLEAKTSDAQIVGLAVHSFLEKWALLEKSEFIDKIETCAQELSNPVNRQTFIFALRNYLDLNITPLLSEDDVIEQDFKIKIDTDAFLVGKMDRVLSSGIILDWKTSSRAIKNIDTDIQFLLYRHAYKRMYNKYPVAVFYVNLSEPELVPLKKPEMNEKELLDMIPKIIIQIRSELFYRSGIFNKACYMCNFKDLCLEKEDGLHS